AVENRAVVEAFFTVFFEVF
ncbi:hypothetical protein D030_2170B, partial [Vibrio parahaemolyticus AQ3810]